MRAWSTLQNIVLHRNSNYGMVGYIARYEKAIQDLDDVNEVVSEKLQKTILLWGIKDDYYKSTITNLKMATNRIADACIPELQKIGMDYDKENSRMIN